MRRFLTTAVALLAASVACGSFYFDTAGSANPVTMQGLKTLVGSSQIVYGTAYPFGGANGSATIARNLERCGFTAAELRAIDRDNALRILPKYRA